MNETPLHVAAEMLEEGRQEMVSSADLLRRRLGKLVEVGHEGRGFDLPTIVSMLARMRDSIETYRTAKAVHQALADQ